MLISIFELLLYFGIEHILYGLKDAHIIFSFFVLIAGLFLYSFEFNFMKGLIRNDIVAAKRFSNTFRYIHDLLTSNNTRNSIGKIYPPELELKITTELSPTTCSYLDLSISITNNKFNTDLYDKRDAFGFRIVNFLHMDSNLPSKPCIWCLYITIG